MCGGMTHNGHGRLEDGRLQAWADGAEGGDRVASAAEQPTPTQPVRCGCRPNPPSPKENEGWM